MKFYRLSGATFMIVSIPYINLLNLSWKIMGWSGGAKVSCILRHRGVQLILAYSWASPAILVEGKGRGGMFFFLLFLHFHSCSSFFPVPLLHLLYYLFYLFSLFLLRHRGVQLILAYSWARPAISLSLGDDKK